MPTQLMPTAEVAAALRISTRQVARLVESGAIEPIVRAPGVRGAFLFDAADVKAFVESRAS